MAPNYVLNKLQEDPRANFMLMRSYQPYSEDESKQQLTSFMVARSDGADLGRLQVYRMDGPSEVQGAAFVANQMQVDKTVSEKVTLLGQVGTKVLFSDLILLPIDKTVVYVRSMYVVSNDTPLVQYVVLSWGQKVYIETTLKAALQRAFPGSNPQTWEAARTEAVGGQPPTGSTPTPTGTSPPGTGPAPAPTAPGGDVQSMLADATRLYDQATEALKAGDTVTWAQRLKDAELKVREAQRLSGATATTTTTTVATGAAEPEPTAPPPP